MKIEKDSIIKLNDFFDFGSKNPINKVAYTEADMQYKCCIIKKMQELEMKVFIDDIGNICGEIGKGIEGEPSIAIGSHTDSVPNGGQFDGVVGVIAGLRAVELIKNEIEEIKGCIKVIVYACEESSRFNIACLGSKYLKGEIDKNRISEIKDKQGMRLSYAIEDARFFIRNHEEKFNINEVVRVEKVIKKDECDYGLELHIEQYQSLSEEGYQIGFVNSIAAPLRMTIKINGEQGHTGTTPMKRRKDAVLAGSRFVAEISEIACEEEYSFRATIPQFETKNWSANVISDDVEMFLDIRMQYPANPDNLQTKIDKIIEKIGKETNTEFTKDTLVEDYPTQTSGRMNNELINIAQELNLKYRILPSWAGHDIAYLPTENKALVFIPSTGGSHNKEESTSEKDIRNGIIVLKEMLKKILEGRLE